MQVTSEIVARAVWAYRRSGADDPARRMREALEYALVDVDTSTAQLQKLVDQFRRLLEEARTALEGLQAKLLALTALGSPRIEDAVLVEESPT